MTAETCAPETGLDFTSVKKSASARVISSVRKAFLASKSNICWLSVASASPGTAGPSLGGASSGLSVTSARGALASVGAGAPDFSAGLSHPAAQMSRALSSITVHLGRRTGACFLGKKRAAIIGRNLRGKALSAGELGDADQKRRAPVVLVLIGDRAVVLVDDLLNDRQSQPGAVALAGGDKGVKERGADLVGHAWAGVLADKSDFGGLLVALHAHLEVAALGHGLGGVSGEVHDRALELASVKFGGLGRVVLTQKMRLVGDARVVELVK